MMEFEETPSTQQSRMEIETPVELNAFIRNPRNFRRLMSLYQTSQPGTVSNRVCHIKTGLEGDDVRIAREDSVPDNVICPDGYHPAFKWPFCCVRDGVDENIRGLVLNTIPQGIDESRVKRLKRTEFGRLYRRLRPRATDELIGKKYKAYRRRIKSLQAYT